jgi:ankyrin repeat protein
MVLASDGFPTPSALTSSLERLPSRRCTGTVRVLFAPVAAAEPALMELVRAIATHDADKVARMLKASPALASESVEVGATRREAATYYLDEINHYVYLGDTALHIAAAAYEPDLVRGLLELGADVSAQNHRGAQPLHYAADGIPGSDAWSPAAQAAVIAALIAAGADPNATDKSGVAPLHRAVRTRCGAAVRALLEGGADATRRNKSGSTPMKLAMQMTGRGGSGSSEAKAQQALIVQLLDRHGAAP